LSRRTALVRLAATLTAAAGLSAGLLLPPAAAAPPAGKGTPVTVMTRNVYLGGDITRPLRPPLPGLTPELSLLQQNWLLRQNVDATDFHERAVLLAREVAGTTPDLIGLQEVALWRHGPFNPAPPLDAQGRVVPTATAVDYDFLQILLDALAAQGVPHTVVEQQVESDVEGPAADVLGGFADAANHRLTMRDVILERAGSAVKVEGSGSEQYDAVLPFTLGGKRYEFIRGYTWADVRVGAKRLRFVNTHLESQLSSFAYLQAQQLLAEVVLPAGRPVVLVCDCNSDPANDSVKPGEPFPVRHSDPYRLLTGPGALHDAWLDSGTADPGWTSGLSETVDDPTAEDIDHRIDLVLTRGVDGAAMPADKPEIVGTDPENRSADGLWPSDHAGVVVRVRP
jgi:endonuclease/exonuclease/phosphatase family metal-dependent hydrolase